jgi:hypothetical protein
MTTFFVALFLSAARAQLAKGEPPPFCPRTDLKGATLRQLGSELNCLSSWLEAHGAGGENRDAVPPEIYDGEVARGLLVADRLRKDLKRLAPTAGKKHEPPFLGPLPPRVSEHDRKAAMQHYLSGVVFFQRGSFGKARAEWELAAKLDPENLDAKAGLERLEKMKAR